MILNLCFIFLRKLSKYIVEIEIRVLGRLEKKEKVSTQCLSYNHWYQRPFRLANVLRHISSHFKPWLEISANVLRHIERISNNILK